MTPTHDVLLVACRAAGIDAGTTELIRARDNTLYRLPGRVVARVGPPGQASAAGKEVRVARWLATAGVPVVWPLPHVDQPVRVGDRAVTFWRELPPHRRATTGELGGILRQLHRLPAPDFELPALEPFVRLRQCIGHAARLSGPDRSWLLEHLGTVEQRYATLPDGLPWCVVHGDARTGNIAVTANGPVMLDLERFACGPPEWDLTSIAIEHTSFGSHSPTQWADFCDRYGHDVTEWPGFAVLRDIRELRKVTFAFQIADEHAAAAAQARYRLACLRDEYGPRPWRWWPVP